MHQMKSQDMKSISKSNNSTDAHPDEHMLHVRLWQAGETEGFIRPNNIHKHEYRLTLDLKNWCNCHVYMQPHPQRQEGWS